MATISRLTRSSLLVLLAATLTTAAYARGGGHAGSNASMHASFGGSAVHATTIHVTTVHSGTIHSSNIRSGEVHVRETIVSKHGGRTLPAGPVALGGGSHQTPDPIVRDHCSFDSICNTNGNWQGQGGLSDFDTPAPNQDHQTGPGGQVNDHRSVVHDHRS